VTERLGYNPNPSTIPNPTNPKPNYID